MQNPNKYIETLWQRPIWKSYPSHGSFQTCVYDRHAHKHRIHIIPASAVANCRGRENFQIFFECELQIWKKFWFIRHNVIEKNTYFFNNSWNWKIQAIDRNFFINNYVTVPIIKIHNEFWPICVKLVTDKYILKLSKQVKCV